MGGKPEYMPTPSEIRRKCKVIQKRWSPRVRLRRMGVTNPEALKLGQIILPITIPRDSGWASLNSGFIKSGNKLEE